MPGYHLPYLGAIADGLFAQQQLGVHVLEPAPGRGPDNVLRVARGDSDFCLTSVHHYLSAREAAGGTLAARFVAVIVRHSPIAAIVPEGSTLTEPADLAGRRIGGAPDKPHGAEFAACLVALGCRAAQQVSLEPGAAPTALANGQVDALVEFVDALPRLRRLTGRGLRAIPVGLPVYASGLVAAERLPADVVARMRAGLVAALRAQRANPQRGLDELVARYPDIRADEALEGWQLVEPYIFAGGQPGAMDRHGWEQTLEFLCDARGMALVDADRVHRRQAGDDPSNLHAVERPADAGPAMGQTAT